MNPIPNPYRVCHVYELSGQPNTLQGLFRRAGPAEGFDDASPTAPSPLNDECRLLGALGPIPQLGRQARNFAQLLGQLLKPLGGLLRRLFRF